VIFIDTHTHLYLREFDPDRDQVVKDALQNGVRIMLLPNIDLASVSAMHELADRYPGQCLPMIGLHPTSVKEDFREVIVELTRLFGEKRYWGIGETGIDLYWETSRAKQQEESFREHIRLAREHGLPLVIHARKSFDELFRILDRENDPSLRGVFHAFTGNEEQAERIIGYGFKLGVGGIVTFKNAGLDSVLGNIDLGHMVLETDAPYLAPVPFRGKRNEPSFLLNSARKLAEIKGLSLSEVAEITTRTAVDLFKLEI
jgi:TatD DNase family protein